MAENASSPAENSFQGAVEYLGVRVCGATAASTLIGSTLGYYQFGKIPTMFYTSAIGGIIGSTVFFGTTAVLKHVRNVDDSFNYAVSGALTLGLFRLPRGRRHVAIGSVAGAVAGFIYDIGSTWFSTTAKQNWIQYRMMMNKSKPRRLVQKEAPKPPPKQEDFRKINDFISVYDPKPRNANGTVNGTDKANERR